MDTLPAEILSNIAEYLDLREKSTLCRVNKRTNFFLRSDNRLWSYVDVNELNVPTHRLETIVPWLRANCKSLTRLNMSECHHFLNDFILESISHECPFIQEFHMNGPSSMFTSPLNPSSNRMKPPHAYGITFVPLLLNLKYLKKLSLSHQLLPEITLKQISTMTTLESLNLSRTGITNEQLQETLFQIGSHLKELSLMNLELSNMSLLFIRQHLCQLESLSLGGCIPSTFATQNLIHLIQDRKTIKSLHFNFLKSSGTEQLLQNLSNMESVRIKNLSLSPDTNHQKSLDICQRFQLLSTSNVFEHLTDLMICNAHYLTDQHVLMLVGSKGAQMRKLVFHDCPLLGFASASTIWELCLILRELGLSDLPGMVGYKLAPIHHYQLRTLYLKNSVRLDERHDGGNMVKFLPALKTCRIEPELSNGIIRNSRE